MNWRAEDLYDMDALKEYLSWMNEQLLDLPESLKEVMAQIHRIWVRDFLWETGMSIEEMESYGDFPCPGCPATSYKEGPHKMSCVHKGKDQLKFSAKED